MWSLSSSCPAGSVPQRPREPVIDVASAAKLDDGQRGSLRT